MARAALVVSAMLLAFVLGVALAPSPAPALVATHPLRVADLRLDAPGDAAASAAATLAATHPAAAPPAAVSMAREVAPPPPAPPPPPPRPEAVLRASLAAVADDHGRLSLILHGAGPGRLVEGDVFMGWRLASVSRSGAVLSKGAQRRAVSFFGPSDASAPTVAGASRPQFLPAPARPMARPPTAAEYFAGYKG